jgi:N-acetylglucosaminyldiphosphoundecaprenol N-acetyl-beta-D-mannosaminyltransferase
MTNKIKKANLPVSEILGTKIHTVSKQQLIDHFKLFLQNKQNIALINYVNAHGLTLAHKSGNFKEVLNNSTILFCDGFGVKIAAKILRQKVGERMTPPDWFAQLMHLLIDEDKRVFFIGDEEGVVSKFVNVLQIDFPELQIVGYHNGFFDRHGEQNTMLINKINELNTDIVITGMGMPIQETWSFENSNRLNVSIVFSTGALFRHYLGIDKRGPRFLTNYGGEWLMRLVFQPKKLWKRYLIGLPHLFFLVLKERIKK